MDIPVPRQALAIWIAASIIYLLIFVVTQPTAVWTFTGARSDVQRSVLEGSLLSAFAALCLWQQLRKVYLTGRSQLLPFFVVWIIFAAGYPLLGGLVMIGRADISLVGPLSDAVQWDLSARAFAAGQLAFLGATAASLIWAIDDPGLGAVRLHRQVALAAIAEVRGRTPPSEFGKAQLDQALGNLATAALQTGSKLLRQRDAVLLQRWWRGATALHAALKARDVMDLPQFDWRTVDSALADLSANG